MKKEINLCDNKGCTFNPENYEKLAQIKMLLFYE